MEDTTLQFTFASVECDMDGTLDPPPILLARRVRTTTQILALGRVAENAPHTTYCTFLLTRLDRGYESLESIDIGGHYAVGKVSLESVPVMPET